MYTEKFEKFIVDEKNHNLNIILSFMNRIAAGFYDYTITNADWDFTTIGKAIKTNINLLDLNGLNEVNNLSLFMASVIHSTFDF